jgi:hypothetical protein
MLWQEDGKDPARPGQCGVVLQLYTFWAPQLDKGECLLHASAKLTLLTLSNVQAPAARDAEWAQRWPGHGGQEETLLRSQGIEPRSSSQQPVTPVTYQKT